MKIGILAIATLVLAATPTLAQMTPEEKAAKKAEQKKIDQSPFADLKRGIRFKDMTESSRMESLFGTKETGGKSGGYSSRTRLSVWKQTRSLTTRLTPGGTRGRLTTLGARRVAGIQRRSALGSATRSVQSGSATEKATANMGRGRK